MGQLFNRFKSISKAYRSGTSPGSVKQNYDVSDTLSEDDYLTRQIEDASRISANSANNFRETPGYTEDAQFDSSCKILGISHNADLNEIKTAYKKQIRKFHPDLYSNRSKPEISDTEHKTAAINAAYDYLLLKRGL